MNVSDYWGSEVQQVCPLLERSMLYLSSLFSYFIQNDVTSQCLSMNVGFKKSRRILLKLLNLSKKQ